MEKEKKYIGALVGCIIVLLFAAAAAVTYPKWSSKVDNLFSKEELVVQEPADTIVEHTFTVQDIVEMRKEEREFRYLDSVYLNMPEVALIAILIKQGIDLSHADIAREYLANKRSYNDVEFGAQIIDMYKHAHNLEPDTIPKKPEIDTSTSAID